MDGFTSAGAQTLIPEAYRAVRARTDALTAHLSAEDCMLQSMDDASPVKWHLGHTTWFWETFILREALADYSVFDLQYHYLFNSYYVSLGDRQARPQRGLLSRPPLEKVRAYRAHVDRAMEAFFDAGLAETYRARIELGIAHEEQHQELILTDLKHGFAQHAFSPAAYPDTVSAQAGKPQSLQDMPFQTFEGGLAEIGRGEEDGFAFDNEGPTHQVYIGPFSLAHRCISNGGWREFMADGGYETPSLWFSEGWARVQSEGWRAPLYWRFKDGDWVRFSLHGEVAIDPAAPVSHVSFHEAAAFAEWSGARLPTEFEWEHAMVETGARDHPRATDLTTLEPRGEEEATPFADAFGSVWQWTRSAYEPYPGFRVPKGAIGEYNGKFMCGQQVLRGSSSATTPGHSRVTYRNFFYAADRWQMTGLRLARDV